MGSYDKTLSRFVKRSPGSFCPPVFVRTKKATISYDHTTQWCALTEYLWSSKTSTEMLRNVIMLPFIEVTLSRQQISSCPHCRHLLHVKCVLPWWRHQMKTFSALLAVCAGISPAPGEFPTQRPVTRSCDVFFDLRLNKRLSKQSWDWWFETLSCPLWRQCNVYIGYDTKRTICEQMDWYQSCI